MNFTKLNKGVSIKIFIFSIFLSFIFSLVYVGSDTEDNLSVSIINELIGNNYKNIRYSDGTNKIILYSANHRNVLRDGKYIPREEATELYPDEYYFKKIQDDGVHDIEIIKYNWTSVEIKPFVKDSKELNKDIPVKINGIENQKINLKSLDNSLDSSIILNFENGLKDNNISFGQASTTITLTSNNTGKEYEDVALRAYPTEIGNNYGANVRVDIAGYDTNPAENRDEWGLFKANRLSELLNGVTILNASWIFKLGTVATTPVNIDCFLTANNWTEGDLDGSAGYPNGAYNSSGTDPWNGALRNTTGPLGIAAVQIVDNLQAGGANEWVTQNLSLSAVQTWISDPKYSMYCGELTPSTMDDVRILSSESAGNEWYLEIEYSTNTPPTNPSPIINSTSINNKTTNDLTCNFMCSDADSGETMTYDINWLKGCSGDGCHGILQQSFTGTGCNQDAYTTAILTSGNISIGEIWWCEVRLYDQESYSGWVNSSSPQIILGTTDECDLGCVQINSGCTANMANGCTLISSL